MVVLDHQLLGLHSHRTTEDLVEELTILHLHLHFLPEPFVGEDFPDVFESDSVRGKQIINLLILVHIPVSYTHLTLPTTPYV